MPGERSTVPTEDRVGLNHLKTSPPTGPESVQQNPQQPVAAVGAQATRRVLLENCKLVTKREDLRLQGSTGSKTGGQQSEKGDEKRAHRGSHHDLTNDPNPCVFRSDGIFGNHRPLSDAETALSSKVTICSALYLLMAMTSFLLGGFSHFT